MVREVLTQDNGDQGAREYGPQAVNKDLPHNIVGMGLYSYLVIKAGNLTDLAYNVNDDAKRALEAGGFLHRVYARADTAIGAAGVDIDLVQQATGAAAGPAVALRLASAAAGTWEVEEVDLAIGTLDLQVTLASALLATEEATLVLEYIKPLA